MINAELGRALDRIADLLEIDGADRFRVNTYRRAARSIRDLTEDVSVMAQTDRLAEIPGVGKGTADRIKQFLSEGRIDVLTELEAKFPPGLPPLLDIPGMGPKKVALAHEKLGVTNLEDLKKVIASGALAHLKGMGETSVKKIAEGIAFLERSGGRIPLGEALPIAEEMLARVVGIKGVRRAELAGSLRRGAETIGDIDLLCDAQEGPDVVRRFVTSGGVLRVLASGDTKGSVTVRVDEQREVQIDLRVVPTESFGAAWQYFTGSKGHNVRLRELAVRRKWKLNEWGLFDGEQSLAGAEEEDVYRRLGLPWIPPELREDRGEFEPKEQAQFEKLVTLADIRGDLHMHTVASDGKNSIEEMAKAARDRGYQYLAICDHSRSSTIANGLTVERMERHIQEIRAADARLKGITILVGCECDILSDGSLDYPDDLLAKCDWVVASVHAAQSGGKRSPTERTLAAIENPYVSAIGHPTGRLINRRAPMDLDLGRIVEAAARTGTMLEINASWQRLDLKDVHVRQAQAAGAALVINTDAHRTTQLEQMRYGVMTARRGGAMRGQIANCGTLASLRKRIARKRLA